jgi:hypothetical protein
VITEKVVSIRLSAWIAFDLDWGVAGMENTGMTIQGRVHNGIVVLEGGVPLPEGAEVTVSYRGPNVRPSRAKKRRIKVPLVRTGKPASLNLTSERIAEILQEEDIANFGKFVRKRKS